MSGLRSGWPVAAVVVLTVLAGCASGPVISGAGSAPSRVAVSAAVSAVSAPSVSDTGRVPPLLRFTATTVDGQSFDGASLAGRPVVLWFWAAWCSTCRGEAGDVAAVQRDFAGRVQVVGVAGLRSGNAAMAGFVSETGVGGFVHLADDAGAIWRRFAVTAQAYFVVLDGAGDVVRRGPLTSGELRAMVAALAG